MTISNLQTDWVFIGIDQHDGYKYVLVTDNVKDSEIINHVGLGFTYADFKAKLGPHMFVQGRDYAEAMRNALAQFNPDAPKDALPAGTKAIKS